MSWWDFTTYLYGSFEGVHYISCTNLRQTFPMWLHSNPLNTLYIRRQRIFSCIFFSICLFCPNLQRLGSEKAIILTLYVNWKSWNIRGIISDFLEILTSRLCTGQYDDLCEYLAWSLMYSSRKLPGDTFCLEALWGVLILDSVSCTFPFMSVPQRMLPGMRLLMGDSGWWPPRLQRLWSCSSSLWVCSCAAGPSGSGAARAPCKEPLLEFLCLFIFQTGVFS